MQTTVSKTIQLSGVGLHSGCRVKMSVLPAPADTGIVFRRVDLPGKPEIRALYSNVVNTQNCTCLGDEKGNLVSTIEHVMAALSVRGVDNAVIEVDGQELPIMIGRGKFFYDALKATELKDLTAPRMYLKVKREVSFTDKNGNTVSLKPAESFVINFAIDFPSKIVGHQIFSGEIKRGDSRTWPTSGRGSHSAPSLLPRHRDSASHSISPTRDLRSGLLTIFVVILRFLRYSAPLSEQGTRHRNRADTETSNTTISEESIATTAKLKIA